MKTRVIFDVQGIQGWIASGGKLLDLTGGSELLESLMGDHLGRAREACGIGPECVEQKAAGRIVLTVDDAGAADRFVQLWALLVERVAPGLRYGLWVGPDDGDDKEQRAAMERDATTPRDLWPVPGPLVHRAQRTGRAAVRFGLVGDGALEGEEAAHDVGLIARRAAGLGARSSSPLLGKFETLGFLAVKKIDDIATYGPSRYVAVVHADGSKIGEAFRHVKKRAPERLPDLSAQLERATMAATREALSELVPLDKGDIPYRPVLLGGDDLTVILPGCHGFDFARAYLQAFETASAGMLARFPEVQMPMFRAGAGVALVQAHFPLEDAITLAEDLCKWAKQTLNRAASGLALHRVTTASTADYQAVIDAELSVKDGDDRWFTTAGPYGVGADLPKGTMTADALRDLADAAKDLSRGALRRPLTDALHRPGRIDDALRRLEELRNDAGRGEAVVAATDRFLTGLVAAGFRNGGEPSFWRSQTDGRKTRHISPLSDLHALLSVEGGSERVE